ncbi:MAG: hypothetical protein JWO36_1058 [Myxococcales bacterium]|nr:hypothetical protein [Myxococcales bacterium]
MVACVAMGACGRFGFEEARDRSDADALSGDGVSGDGSAALRCSSLPASCGPTGISSCCGNLLVPGGTFRRSFDVGADLMFNDMTHPATVADFRLDTYEVTVGRFRQFVMAGMGTRQHPPAEGAGARTLNGSPNQGGWDASWNVNLTTDTAALTAALNCPLIPTWTDAPGANESLPIDCVTWFEAMAFCTWDGGFLPTEAQWNYAAAGGSEQRVYPWSSPPTSTAIDCSYLNYNDNIIGPCDGKMHRVGDNSPKGDGKWGQADLAGNVREWTLDWYVSPYGNPCTNCADLTVTPYRSVRGGNLEDDAMIIREAYRSYFAPTFRSFDFGVRCARSP